MTSLDEYAAATAALNHAYNPSPAEHQLLEAAVGDAANQAHRDGYTHQDLARVYVPAPADGSTR